MPGRFVDSNVLLYLSGRDERKADLSAALLNEQLTISVQVLNEIARVMIGKWHRSWDETDDLLALVRQNTVVQFLDERTHELGLEVARQRKLGIFDSMIVASALLAGCDTLYSEDMHHGLVVENRLTIVNPFA